MYNVVIQGSKRHLEFGPFQDCQTAGWVFNIFRSYFYVALNRKIDTLDLGEIVAIQLGFSGVLIFSTEFSS
jgi:hypothetical protein